MTTGCPALVFDGNDVFINTSQCNGAAYAQGVSDRSDKIIR